METLTYLIQQLRSSDSALRTNAAASLVQLGAPRTVEPLCQLLGDEDPDVTHSARSLLSQMGAAAVSGLCETLRHGNVDARWSAAVVLGRTSDPRAAGPLAEALRDEDHHVGESAMLALIEIGSIAAESVLPLLRDERKSVRVKAATVLGRMKDPVALPPLLEILEQDPDWRVRCYAAEALGDIGDSRSVASLCSALESEDSVLQSKAAKSLGKIRDPHAVSALCRTLVHGARNGRWLAAEALGQIRNRRAVEFLCQALQDEYEEVRIHAATALSLLGDRRVVEPLCTALKDHRPKARAAVAASLGALGDSRAAEFLTPLLQGQPAVVRTKAMEALKKLCAVPQQSLAPIYTGTLVRHRDGLSAVSMQAASLLCECCGGHCHQLLVVPGHAIGRGNRTYCVVRCLNCTFWDPYYVYHDGDLPVRVKAPVGQCHDFTTDGLSLDSFAGIEWIPGEPDPSRMGWVTFAGGEPRWLQNDEWPDCPECEVAMEFVLQLSTDTLDTQRHGIELGHEFAISIEHYATLYFYMCESCNVSCSVTQCTYMEEWR